MRPDYGETHMAIPIHFVYGRAMVSTMATIGERIRDRRKVLKLRQGDLAELIGVDQSTVSDIERGKGFGADVLMRLSNALRVAPQFVMNGDEGSKEQIDARGAMSKDVAKGNVNVEGCQGSPEEVSGGMGENESALCQPIPTSMTYSAPNLKSCILLMGSLVGALDRRSRRLIGELLKDLAEEPDDAEDIANKASGLATIQKPISKNKDLNKGMRGRRDSVETKPAKLEH
jgi:transcriptional regulator with XRE-family HTH domain